MAKKKANKPKRPTYNADAIFESTEQKRTVMKQYCDLIIQGTSTKQLTEMLEAQFDLTFEQSVEFLSRCRTEIAKATAIDYPDVVAVHTQYYELIYKRFRTLDWTPGMLGAMKQKEKIMGLLEEEDNEIIINNQTNLTLQNTVYDMTKLSQQEKDRLQQLLKKLNDGQKPNNREIEK